MTVIFGHLLCNNIHNILLYCEISKFENNEIVVNTLLKKQMFTKRWNIY